MLKQTGLRKLFELRWTAEAPRVDLLQVDLLASGASLFWRPTASDEKSFVPLHLKSDEGLFWKSKPRVVLKVTINNIEWRRSVQDYRKSSIKPPEGLFFSSIFEGGLKREGGLFNLAKRITCSKNTVVWDRVDLRVVQLKSLSKVFNSLVGA